MNFISIMFTISIKRFKNELIHQKLLILKNFDFFFY